VSISQQPLRVVAVEPAAPSSEDVVLSIDGQPVETAQSHLLAPFAALLAALDRLGDCGAGSPPGGERTAVEGLYRALYGFFQTLLPSARHDAIDGLAYSAALLLVGEAIEAASVVQPAGASPTAHGGPHA
jgi:hypothetical protein